MNNSKEKIIIICILAVVLIGVIALILMGINKSGSNENTEPSQTIDSSQLIDLEDIKTSSIETKKIKDLKIASKYPSVKEAYIVDAKVNMYLDNNHTGRAIYVRDGNTKLNILQFKYETQPNDTLIKIDKILNEFEQKCTSNFNLYQEETQNSTGKKIPVSEKIFANKELHSTRYVAMEPSMEVDKENQEAPSNNSNESKKYYDINFYMDANNLICELVRLF